MTNVWGIDFSINDKTRIAIFDKATNGIELVEFPPMPMQEIRPHLVALAKLWQPDLVLSDASPLTGAYIEMMLVERLPIRIFQVTKASREEIYTALGSAIENNQIAFHPGVNPESEDRRLVMALAYHASKLINMTRVNVYK